MKSVCSCILFLVLFLQPVFCFLSLSKNEFLLVANVYFELKSDFQSKCAESREVASEIFRDQFSLAPEIQESGRATRTAVYKKGDCRARVVVEDTSMKFEPLDAEIEVKDVLEVIRVPFPKTKSFYYVIFKFDTKDPSTVPESEIWYALQGLGIEMYLNSLGEEKALTDQEKTYFDFGLKFEGYTAEKGKACAFFAIDQNLVHAVAFPEGFKADDPALSLMVQIRHFPLDWHKLRWAAGDSAVIASDKGIVFQKKLPTEKFWSIKLTIESEKVVENDENMKEVEFHIESFKDKEAFIIPTNPAALWIPDYYGKPVEVTLLPKEGHYAKCIVPVKKLIIL